MKAKQLEAQYEAQNRKQIRQHSTRRRMFTGLAAAALAILTCGAVTAGAVNNWNYTALLNRWFHTQSDVQEDFDFTGMGLDFNEEIDAIGYSMVFQSVVADANAIHAFCNFRMDPEYEAQFPQTDETLYGSCTLNMRIMDASGSFVDNGAAWSAPAPQNKDGSFDCMTTIGLKDFREDLSGLTLVVYQPESARVGLKQTFMDDWDSLVETPEPTTSGIVKGRYSLEGISSLPHCYKENVAMQSEGNLVQFDSVTVSPMEILFRRADIPVTPATTNEPGVTIGAGTYCIGMMPEDNAAAEDAAAEEEIPEYIQTDPTPEEFKHLAFVSVTLIYSNGTEQDAEIYLAEGAGRTKKSETDQYDLMDFECYASFAKPYSIDGLTAVRINGAEIPLT